MITDLRYIERDGEKVLQYSSEQEGCGLFWSDVPTVTKGPARMITSAEFWEAFRSVTASEAEYLSAVSITKQLAKKLGLESKP